VENPVTVRPFSTDSAVLSKHLKTEIVRLARRLKSNGEKTVTLVGYGDSTASTSRDSIVSRARARAVEKFLRRELRTFRVRGITIVADGEAATSTVTANGEKLSRAMVRTVVAVLS
jgi:outer membrane protein OmpA-like peptidoglycan-associated protein